MIHLTPEQLIELRSHDPAQIRDPATGVTYILVPQPIYERLCTLLEDEPVATGKLVDRIMADDDANDPYLAEFQRLYGDS